MEVLTSKRQSVGVVFLVFCALFRKTLSHVDVQYSSMCVNVIEQCSRYMGSMHASHGGRGAVAWGGQHAKHTAWQSNEIILAGGYHAKAIDRLVQCMKCWGAGAITESSAPPPHWPFYFLLFAVMSLPQ